MLILECLDKSDPGSEGKFLAHMLRLMGLDPQYVEIRTKRQFLVLIGTAPYEIVHITTHGSFRERRGNKKFRGFWFPDGTLRESDLERLRGKLKGCAVVSTACLSGNRKFAKTFVNTTGCRYYMAPEGSPKFHNAIFFAHIFYHKLFVLKKAAKRILQEYRKGFRNPHKFRLTPFGK